MELTSDNVRDIMRSTLLTGEEMKSAALPHAVIGEKSIPENPPGVLLSHGIINLFAFNEERLRDRTDDVKSLLSQLHNNFLVQLGGGWSMLNAVMDQAEVVWGSQQDADALFCLGQALGLCQYCLPRNLWIGLPGGMPYFVVNLNGFSTKESA